VGFGFAFIKSQPRILKSGAARTEQQVFRNPNLKEVTRCFLTKILFSNIEYNYILI